MIAQTQYDVRVTFDGAQTSERTVDHFDLLLTRHNCLLVLLSQTHTSCPPPLTTAKRAPSLEKAIVGRDSITKPFHVRLNG